MKKIIQYTEISDELKAEIEAYQETLPVDERKQVTDLLKTTWLDDFIENWLSSRLHEGKNKRRHLRFDVQLPLRIVDIIIDSKEAELIEEGFVGTVLNMSKGGFYFVSKFPLKAASIIKIVIDLSPVDKKIDQLEALAMVVRSDKNKDSDDYGIAVTLSSIYDDDKEKLDYLILKHLSNVLSVNR